MKDDPFITQSVLQSSLAAVEGRLDAKIGMVLEKMEDNTLMIMELLEPIKKIPKMEEDIADMKQDIHVIKAVLTATNRDVADHEKRITRLEAKSA